MKCSVPGNMVKLLGRVVHSLSKIGNELYFESLPSGLALRTVNSARSAYVYFLFNPTFFSEYDTPSRQSAMDGDSEEDSTRCKLAVKSCLSVFRSLATIDKSVEYCKLSFNSVDARLVFQLYCRHGIVKTHNLGVIECESLQASFSAESALSHLTAPAKLFSGIVANFQMTQEEVTIIVSQDSVLFKNYCDDATDLSKVMYTEMRVSSDEFDVYTIGKETEITFCLKEFRAILAFCDATNLPLSMNFDTAGRPVIFTLKGDNYFVATFVLATLAEEGTDHNTQNETDKNISESSKRKRDTNQPTSQQHGNMTTIEIDNNTSMMHRHSDNILRHNTSQAYEAVPNSQPWSPADPITVNTHAAAESPVIPNQHLHTQNVIDLELPDMELPDMKERDNLDESIPGTPPNKKFKSLFFPKSQPAVSNIGSQQNSEVLAENTDEDD